MLNYVMFTNQGTAENNPGMPGWAVISITDYEEARIKHGWYAIHRSSFHDIDMDQADHESRLLMTGDQALEIVDYVHAVAPHIESMLVHCRGGVSRSAAVAKWITEVFKLPFDRQYDLYNRHVYRQLVEASDRRRRRPL